MGQEHFIVVVVSTNKYTKQLKSFNLRRRVEDGTHIVVSRRHKGALFQTDGSGSVEWLEDSQTRTPFPLPHGQPPRCSAKSDASFVWSGAWVRYYWNWVRRPSRLPARGPPARPAYSRR